jgi:hypothetical protein
MADLIVRCAFVIAALSPIWRRLYIGHFWVRGRATVIQVNLELVQDGEGMCSAWVPTIEYYAHGRRWVQQKGPHSKYRVGDQFDILYNPRKPWRCTLPGGWLFWIWCATFTGALGMIFAPL